jgi:hypothetical protein
MSISLSRFAVVLKTYGFFGIDSCHDSIADYVHFSSLSETFAPFRVHAQLESHPQLYYPSQKWRRMRFFTVPQPVYHALLPHITFTGSGLRPVWVNQAGRAVVAWYRSAECQTLLIGLDLEEEMVRHRQGDPTKVDTARVKSGFGFDFERPNYMFEDQLHPQYRTIPWADHLGFYLAETCARLSGYPLIEPLPQGARAAVILTGDDDQAFLEKYAEQLRIVGHLPITYFLHPLTRHTRETLEHLPPNVELGLHPDALDKPEAYDQLCMEQAQQMHHLSGKPMHLVRNHGYLNRGYLGHLNAWQASGLQLDVNYPGVDGTALNASFLPMRLRQRDGTWTEHYSLLTLFGDGMLYALQFTQHQAVQRVNQLVRQMERDYPGVIVCNFHPQNITDTYELHQAVLAVARRPGWIALGLGSYLQWLEMRESLRIIPLGKRHFLLTSPGLVRDLVLRYPTARGWCHKQLAPWTNQTQVRFD